jgi:CDP-diacylglycerol--glycerol-3-phosphate 3-phosphatidyltransferase
LSGSRLTLLPNVITVARILACPAIFALALAPGLGARFGAFALFVVAGLSDFWDGWLARRYDLITDMGKLLDPIADKLLLASTLIPFYLISHRPSPLEEVPVWGPLPLWVLLVIFGRETFMTLFRAYAVRRGVVIAAGRSGKHKTLLQSLFIGGLLLWYPAVHLADARGWSGTLWSTTSTFIELWCAVTLAAAIVLTIYSMLDYLWSYRSLVGIRD